MTTVAHSNIQAPGATPAQPMSPAKGGKFGVPALPQVSLLPPEVGQRREVAAAQRRMVWGIIATLVLIVVAFGGAFLVRAEAEIRHLESLATADQLLAERREYAPVVQVINDIDETTEARAYVLETEVNWQSYVYAIAAVLPDDVTMDTVEVEVSGAGEDPVDGADVLTRDGVAVMTFESTSPTLPVASEWIDAIESVPGLEDANIQSAELQDETGETAYTVTATIQVTDDALAHRTFADQAADVTDAAEGETADTEDGE
ncbi:PilN domain-containing protein [Demequina sp. NBRC 110053]|uniref:PilN domain-containing protein n=1 Tax=Demequina sp. NBRC 110053 TaxID=1570342 RepID=UPI0009FE54E6|nr:hypothetical protein [Demequina sp. NBRC 110053]